MANILIVDDSSFQRRMVRAILTRLGHEVEEAECGAKGLAMVQTRPPDVVILDLLMPGLTGYEVLEKLRDVGSPVPRIVLTADVQEASKKECLDLGAAHVLNKPPNESDLQRALEQLLAAAEPSR